MSVKLTGCGPKYAALLHQAGYNNTKLLCGVTPTLLQQHLETINSEMGIVARVPQLPTLELWVNEARSTPLGLIIARRPCGKEIFVETGDQQSVNVAARTGFELYVKVANGIHNSTKQPDRRDTRDVELPGKDRRKKPWIPPKKR